jgi:hypothetical protein
VSISDLVGVRAVAALLVATAGCGAGSGDCLRYSDCSEGLTCAAGRCVAPPPSTPPDGATGDDGGLGTTSDDSGTVSATEASDRDASFQLGDAPAE